jgi:hypothetical protein
VWPLANMEMDRSGHEAYLFPLTIDGPRQEAARGTSGSRFTIPSFVRFVMFGFMIVALAHCLIMWGLIRFSIPYFRRFALVPPERSQYLVGCLGALTIGAALVQYVATTESTFDIGSTWTAVASVATTVVLMVAVLSAIYRYLRHTFKRAARKYDLAFGVALTVITLVAAVFFVAFVRSEGLLSDMRWMSTWISGNPPALVAHVAFAERLIAVFSGVSPAVPLLLLAGAVYLWGVQHLRRPFLPRAVDIKAQLIKIECAIDKSRQAAEELCGSLGRAMIIALFASACGYTLLFSMARIFGPDGHHFNGLYATALIIVLTLTSLSLVHFVHLWRSLSVVLASVARQPRLLAAFRRLPAAFGSTRVLTTVPRMRDLDELVRRSSELAAKWPPPDVVRPLADISAFAALEKAFAHDCRANRDAVWSRTKTSRLLGRASTHIKDAVGSFWSADRWQSRKRPARELAIAGLTPALATLTRLETPAAGAEPEHADRWFDHAEEFLSLWILLSIRNVLGRLVNGLGIIAGGNILALASYTVYPFQPQQLLFAIGWANIVVAATAILYVLVQIERNEALSAITHTEPGEVNMNATLVLRLVMFVAIPLFTLFAAQFPSIGSWLVRWMEPIQRIVS